MGRKRLDKRLDTLKENLLDRLVKESEPKSLVNLLVAYFQLIDIMEREKQIKIERKLTAKANR